MSRLRGVLADPLLSVVMPAFNEKDTIEEIIRRVLAVPLRIELIAVDDCSTDGTRDQLQTLARELGFTLVLQPRNGGKGAALRSGFERVNGDLVIAEQVHGLALPGCALAAIKNTAVYEMRDGQIAAWRDYTNPNHARALLTAATSPTTERSNQDV